MKPQRLLRRERECLRHRQEMLDAAHELFAEKGYHEVSMHEIAARAEFAVGTLYKFFKSKEELYKALMLDRVHRVHAAISAALEGPGDEVEKLRNYVRAKAEVLRANVAAVRLYFSETPGAAFNVLSGLESDIRALHRRFLQSLAAVFEKGMKKKRFKRIASPFHLAVALTSLTNAFLFLWIESPDQHPFPDDPDVILNLLFKGLMDGQETD